MITKISIMNIMVGLLYHVAMSAREVDIDIDARLYELVIRLVEAKPELGFESVEDFVETAVETWLKEHSQQA